MSAAEAFETAPKQQAMVTRRMRISNSNNQLRREDPL
jgi:hypothetical protein